MVFDGRLQINWRIYKGRHYYGSKNTPSSYLSYIDVVNNRLENQIPMMITELYKRCCDNEISAHLDHKKWVLEYEREKEEEQAKELREEQQIREQKRQAHRNSLINDISVHANNWFKHEQLSRYADDLEARLAAYEDEETVQLLKEYIRLVRENADTSNPLNHILREMRAITSQEDN